MNLTTKELGSIEDSLYQEETLIKKFKMYSTQSCDPQLKQKYEQIASKHQEHYNKLVNMLNS